MLDDAEGIEHPQRISPRAQVLPTWNKTKGHLSQSKSERLKKEVLLFSFMLGKNIPPFLFFF